MARLSGLLLACLLASGCFAFDEIDAGLESMNKGPAPAADTGDAKAGGGEGEAGPPGGWWASARSLNEGPSAQRDAGDAGDPSAPVSCRIGGSTRFMRRGDCLSQGGTPK